MHYSIFSSFPDSSIRTYSSFLLFLFVYFGFSMTLSYSFHFPCCLTFFLEIHSLISLCSAILIAASFSFIFIKGILLVRFRFPLLPRDSSPFLSIPFILIGYRLPNIAFASEWNFIKCFTKALLYLNTLPFVFSSLSLV